MTNNKNLLLTRRADGHMVRLFEQSGLPEEEDMNFVAGIMEQSHCYEEKD